MNRIRFLHIPKTAGTSFADSLSRIYPGERFTFSGNVQRDHERYYELEPTKRAQLTLVSGHSPRITGIPEIDSLPTITFLREPVERVLSFCQHVSEGKSPDLLDRFPPETFDLNEFLDSGNPQFYSLHARMLLGSRGYELPAWDTAALAEKAMTVLQDDMECFGVVEEFDKSLMLFRRKLGWEGWPVYRRLNVAGESEPLAFREDQIERIREFNVVDIEVYENAHRVLGEEFDKMSDQLAADLQQFEHRQQLWAADARSSRRLDEHSVASSWSERMARATRILRTQGVRALLQEIQQFTSWLRASTD